MVEDEENKNLGKKKREKREKIYEFLLNQCDEFVTVFYI
jgi:hypothetical protein